MNTRARFPLAADRKSILGAAVVAALAFDGVALAAPVERSGAAAWVQDGDTLTVGGISWRLWGINAPELHLPGGGASRAGVAAREALRTYVAGRSVTCRSDGARSYNRVVGVCRTDRGEDLALLMVSSGYAVDWPRFSRGYYARAEREARANARGLQVGRGLEPK